MNIRRIGIAGLLAACAFNVWSAPATAPASAGKTKLDVTGTWTATVEAGRGPAMNMEFVLKQNKDKLSGTMSTNGAAPVEITDAKVYRTKVIFSVETTMTMPAPPGQKAPPPMKMVTQYTATVDGDDMTIETQMKGGMMGGMPMGGMGGGGMGPPPGGGGGGGMGGPPPGGGMGGGMMMGGMKPPAITAHRQ